MFKGSMPALVTPFRNGELDLETLKRLVEWQIAEGSTGKLAINRFSNTDANRFDANDDPDGDGYPNIEEYLNSLARDDRRYDGFIGSGTGSLPPYNCGRAMF